MKKIFIFIIFLMCLSPVMASQYSDEDEARARDKEKWFRSFEIQKIYIQKEIQTGEQFVKLWTKRWNVFCEGRTYHSVIFVEIDRNTLYFYNKGKQVIINGNWTIEEDND